jgi:hypothetical protein
MMPSAPTKPLFPVKFNTLISSNDTALGIQSLLVSLEDSLEMMNSALKKRTSFFNSIFIPSESNTPNERAYRPQTSWEDSSAEE